MIVDEYRGTDVHGRDQHESLAHAAGLHLLRHLVGDVDDLLALPGLEPEVVRVTGHRSSSSSFIAVSVFSSRYFTMTGAYRETPASAPGPDRSRAPPRHRRGSRADDLPPAGRPGRAPGRRGWFLQTKWCPGQALPA